MARMDSYGTATPEDGDSVVGIDISDTTQNAAGSTKRFLFSTIWDYISGKVGMLATPYASRAAFIADTLPVGATRAVWIEGGNSYAVVRDAGGTITGAGGSKWSPDGDAYPDHWAANTSPGTTDMAAAVIAALAWSKTVHLRGVAYRIDFTGTDGVTPQAGTHIIGRTGAELKFVPSSSSYRTLISQSGIGLRIDNVKVTVAAQATQVVVFIGVGAASGEYEFNNCIFDGGITYSPGRSHTSYMLSMPNTGTQEGFTINKCSIGRYTWTLLKTNASTSTQRRHVISGNSFRENYLTPLSFNSPNGVCTDISIVNNFFHVAADQETGVTTAHIAFANVQQATVTGNTFSGDVKEAIHIEENCRGISIVGNVFNTSKTAIQVVDNLINTGGLSLKSYDMSITGNTFRKSGTAKAAATYGINLVFDVSAATPMSQVVISGNTFSDYYYGVSTHCAVNDAVEICHNIFTGCAEGIRLNAMTNRISGNTTHQCEIDISGGASGSAIIKDHHFSEYTLSVSTSARGVTLLNPRWSWPMFSVAASATVPKVLTRMGANDRCWGVFHSVAVTENNASGTASEAAEYSWDGSAATGPTNKYSRESGALITAMLATGGDLTFRVYSGTLQNVRATCELAGSISIGS